MTQPDFPSVAQVLEGVAKLAATHESIDAMHRQAYDDAAPADDQPIESDSIESTAL